MSGVINGTTTKFNGFLDGHVVAITSVQDTISKGRSRTDRETFTLKTGSITVDVEESRSLQCIKDERQDYFGTVLSQPVTMVPIERPIPL